MAWRSDKTGDVKSGGGGGPLLAIIIIMAERREEWPAAQDDRHLWISGRRWTRRRYMILIRICVAGVTAGWREAMDRFPSLLDGYRKKNMILW
jgi:hypothetical protein